MSDVAKATPRVQVSPEDFQRARIENQVTLSGTNPTVSDLNRVYFLEYVCATAAGVVLTDYLSRAVSSTVIASAGNTAIVDLANSPLRFDGGFTLTGVILFAKCFFVQLSQPQKIPAIQ